MRHIRKSRFNILFAGLRIALAFYAVVVPATSSQLLINESVAVAGTRALVPVNWTSQQRITTIRFEIEYNVSLFDLTFSPEDRLRLQGITLNVQDVGPGKVQVSVAAPAGGEIPSGTILHLLVAVHSNAPTADCEIRISNILSTNQDGRVEVVSTTAGSVSIRGVAGQGTTLDAANVVNGVSLLPGPIAAGEYVRIVAPGIGPEMDLGAADVNAGGVDGWTVTFNGVPAELLAAKSGQLDLIVPEVVSGKTRTHVAVNSGNRLVGEIELPVVASVPAIATADASGVGPGAVWNEDSTPNSVANPAAPGSSISILATGNIVSEAQPAAAAASGDSTVIPMKAQIGGIETPVVKSNPVHSGLNVFVARIPPEAGSGPDLPIRLSAGRLRSQPGVTVAVAPALPVVSDAGEKGIREDSTISTKKVASPPATHFYETTAAQNRTVRIGRSVTLSWVASPTATVSGYTVFRATVSGGPYTSITPTLVAGTNYVDTAVQAGQTYYYVVTASDTYNNASDYSNEAVAVVPPYSVALSWAASTSPNISGYTVYRGSTPGGPYIQLSQLVSRTDYQDYAVVSGAIYYYVITASDTNNNTSDYSNEAQALVP